MKESYDEDEDGYNLTYYERGTQNRIVNIEGQISNLRRGLSDALKMLKCLILTLGLAVVIIVSLLVVIIVMASFPLTPFRMLLKTLRMWEITGKHLPSQSTMEM